MIMVIAINFDDYDLNDHDYHRGCAGCSLDLNDGQFFKAMEW